MELTEPGRAFLEAARTALAAADAAVEAALVAAGGSVGEVSLGVSSGAWYGLGELFEPLRTTYPNVRLDVRQQSGGPAVGAIRRGELDVSGCASRRASRRASPRCRPTTTPGSG